MTTLTVTDLFTPAPSGVGPFGNVPMVPPAGTWLAVMLTNAAKAQLPTTSWQSGAPERTIFAVEAVTFSMRDVNISVMAQGAFLQSAASGTVTYTTVDGTTVVVPVTPDPSNTAQNPTGQLGWLDILGTSRYNVIRLAATAAAGPLAIVNTTGVSKGPFVAGSYHAANTQSGATYANTATLTIPSSAIAGTGGLVIGVQPGVSFTIIDTQTAHGLSANQVAYVNVPTSSGITGLAGVFATILSVTSTTMQLAITSGGTYTSGGTVSLCTVIAMSADVVGIAGNAGPGTVTTTVTQFAGVFCSNVIGWSGSNWETNASYASRCQLSLAAASPNGPAAAYDYFAETAAQLLAARTPPYTLTNGPVSATTLSVPALGQVYTIVASSTPASVTLGANVTPGVAQLPITGVTSANPCVVTCSAPTTLTVGQTMTVTISGVLGTTSANGTFLATYVGANSFSIPIDTTLAGSYTGGGSVEGGDLGQIDRLLQNNAVPDEVTAITVSAQALPVQITATVVVPQAYVATYQLAVLQQLQTQINSYAVGGNAPNFSVAYNDIVGALEEAGVLAVGTASYVRVVQALSLNGGGNGVGVPFPTNFYQAVLSAPNITVLGT